MPGSPLDPRAEGTNDLLRQGAIICTSPQDVIAALEPMLAKKPKQPELFQEDASLEPEVEPLWDELDLSGAAGSTTPAVMPMLEMDETETLPFRVPSAKPSSTEISLRITGLLGPSPVSLDELARAADLPVAEVRSALLGLELEGRLERHGAGLVSMPGG